jgi:VanZ family protein
VHKSFIFISISLTLLIALVSLMPIDQQLNLPVNNLDKVVHTSMYFLLSLSWLKTLKPKKDNINYIFKILFLIMLYGIIIEVLQEVLTTYRHGDIKDVIANVVGIIIAALVFKIIRKKN